MRDYAQTYPDLIIQGRRKNLSVDDLMTLRKTYEYAEKLFDGIYRGEHVPFICHAVRTASILLEEGLPIEVVQAEILHATYSLGCFSDRVRGRLTDQHQKEVLEVVSPEVNALVIDYDQRPWYGAEHIKKHLEEVDGYSERDKHLILMRVANEIDDYMELGMVFRGGKKYKGLVKEYGPMLLELTRKVGHPVLADELESVFNETLRSDLPEGLVVGDADQFGECYVLPVRKWLEMGIFERVKIKVKKRLGLSKSA